MSSCNGHTCIYFNPLPPQGGRRYDEYLTDDHTYDFNPLPPQGGRQRIIKRKFWRQAISIHSLPKEGDINMADNTREFRISIHSLPKEGDFTVISVPERDEDFNPLPPQGGRLEKDYSKLVSVGFQSTPSPRRETSRLSPDLSISSEFQSTPSPRRETPHMSSRLMSAVFQSTPSPRRETGQGRSVGTGAGISIHSLPKEGDQAGQKEVRNI